MRHRGAVLSDDRIVEILRKTGIDIARRTVAKYREAMRIPSSVERRRLKQGMNLSDGIGALAPSLTDLGEGLHVRRDSRAVRRSSQTTMY